MNINIKKKREKIVNKFKNIINNIDYNHLDYVEKYILNNNFELNLKKIIEKSKEKNEERIKLNCIVDELFMNIFKNYYYNSTSNIYFCYDNVNFININIDDIYYNILNNVNKKYNLTSQNKLYIKNQIIKKIKINNYEDIIPESITIQKVINYLNPIIFESKIYSKFFLTFIGDIIMKKVNNEKLFIVNCNNNFKIFLKKLNKLISLFFFNVNIFNNIKTKFYGHETKNIFILYLNNNINKDYLNIEINQFINLLFISIYNSNRYENIDSYIKWTNNTIERKYITQLNNIDINKLVLDFWDKNIIINQESSLNQESILFLWKGYLKQNKLPIYLLFQHNFIQLFNEVFKLKIKNMETIVNSLYLNITSYNIPEIQIFLDFWDKEIIVDKDENYLEFEEIEAFFSVYLKQNYNKNYYKLYTKIKILDVIKHYYGEEVKIINDKYFDNLRLKLWNKKEEIVKFKKNYINDIKYLTLDKIYILYCKTKKLNQQQNNIISKNYFMEYYNQL